MTKKFSFSVFLFILVGFLGFAQDQGGSTYRIIKLERMGEDITSKVEFCMTTGDENLQIFVIMKKNYKNPDLDWEEVLILAEYNSTTKVYGKATVAKIELNGTGTITREDNNIYIEILSSRGTSVLKLEGVRVTRR